MDASFLILLAFFGVMYLLLIRPQQKRQKQHQEMVRSMAVGTDIVTIGGLHGRVVAVDDEVIDLAVDEQGTVLRFQRSSVAKVLTPEADLGSSDVASGEIGDTGDDDEDAGSAT